MLEEKSSQPADTSNFKPATKSCLKAIKKEDLLPLKPEGDAECADATS